LRLFKDCAFLGISFSASSPSPSGTLYRRVQLGRAKDIYRNPEPGKKRPLKDSDTEDPVAKRNKTVLWNNSSMDDERAATNPASVREMMKDTHLFNDAQDRVRVYDAMSKVKDDDDYTTTVNTACEVGEEALSRILHDSPPDKRDLVLREIRNYQSDPTMYSRIVQNISDLEIHSGIIDPFGLLPKVVTRAFLQRFLKKERKKGDRRDEVKCHCCGGLFCTPAGESDVQNVVWKLCGRHVMHLDCFVKAIKEGEMPLYGFCECVAEEN
jgi:hypothetical protein